MKRRRRRENFPLFFFFFFFFAFFIHFLPPHLSRDTHKVTRALKTQPRRDKTQSKQHGFYRSRDEDHHHYQRQPREQPRLVVFTCFGAQMQNDFDEGIDVFQQTDDSADDEKKRNSENSSHHEEFVRNSRANFG